MTTATNKANIININEFERKNMNIINDETYSQILSNNETNNNNNNYDTNNTNINLISKSYSTAQTQLHMIMPYAPYDFSNNYNSVDSIINIIF